MQKYKVYINKERKIITDNWGDFCANAEVKGFNDSLNEVPKELKPPPILEPMPDAPPKFLNIKYAAAIPPTANTVLNDTMISE